jgi:hypothetical protein
VIGPKREPGSRHGLTRKQAEAQLRRLIQEVRSAPPGEHLTLEEAGERYIRHVEVVLERKPTTVSDYRSILRRHLAAHFGQAGVDKITTEHVAAYLAAKADEGLSTKTISNHLNFVHGLFAFAVKRGWTSTNPVSAVEGRACPAPNPTSATWTATRSTRYCVPSPTTGSGLPTGRCTSPRRWRGCGRGSSSRFGGRTWTGSPG